MAAAGPPGVAWGAGRGCGERGGDGAAVRGGGRRRGGDGKVLERAGRFSSGAALRGICGELGAGRLRSAPAGCNCTVNAE